MVALLGNSNSSKQQKQPKKVKQPGMRFCLVTLFVFIVFTSAIAGVGLWSAWQQANQNVNQHLTSSLTYLNSWLEDENTANKIAAEGLASQRSVVAALLQHQRGKPELDRLLTVGLLRKLSVSFIAFVDSDRNVITSEPTNLPQEWLPKTAIEAALVGQPLPAEAELGQNKLLLTASASVQNENQTVGVVVLGDLLDDTTTTAVDMKRATGLDVAVVLKGKLQTTTLPLPTNQDASKLLALPDLSEIETALKTQDQLIKDIRLKDQTYKVGYKAILSNRYLIGEVMLLLPQAEIDQTWWNQAVPLLVVPPITWLVGGLMLFYLFNHYLPSLDIYPPALPLTANHRRNGLDSLTASEISPSSSLPMNATKGSEALLLTSHETRVEVSSGILDSTDAIFQAPSGKQGIVKVETDFQNTERFRNLGEQATSPFPLITTNQQSETGWEYFGSLALNRAAYEAKLEGQPLSMTRTEFELLCVLVSRPNKVISRNELISLVWGENYLGEPGTVDAHISNLRRKVEADPMKPAMIVTVRGVGYKFQPPI